MSRTKRFLAGALLAALSAAYAQDSTEPAAKPGRSELNGELFYRVLVGELSAQSGDTSTAFGLMLDSARKTSSPELFERAVTIALQARYGESALEAARAWQKALPQSKEANLYVLQILIGLNRIGETLEPLKREIASVPAADRVAAIAAVPRYYARTTEKAQAASVVEQALATELNTPTTAATAWSAVGSLRMLAADTAGALEAARKGLAADPKAEYPAYLALDLMAPKLPAAEALVQEVLAHRATAVLRMGYARKLLDTGRLSDAYAQMLLINKAQPSFADAWLVRGSLEWEQKNPGAAQTSLTTYLGLAEKAAPPADTPAGESSRGQIQAYLLLSQIAEKNNQIDKAQSYLDRINTTQDALRVQVRRATLMARQGKLDAARKLIRTTPELRSDDARAKLNAELQLLQDFKQNQLAYDFLNEVLAQYPSDTDWLYQQSMVADKLNKLDEMEQLLRKVIELQPNYHHAYNALGYSFADRNIRLPEARALIVKALEFAPEDPFIIDSMAWVEFRSGNLSEAVRLLEKAYSLRVDAEIAAHLGEVLWVQGDKARASSVWNKALAQSPDNETLRQTVLRLRGHL